MVITKEMIRLSLTFVAVGIKQRCGVREACAVGVVVDGPHPGLVSATVLARDIDGIADAAVGQPAGVTLIQTSLPGEEELPDSCQLGSQRVAVCGGRGQAQLLRHRRVENLSWKDERG